jgi:hypothetical protein
MPDLGQCCQLTTVVLPDDGVTLTAQTPYWLVASPNDSAADFTGGWMLSNFGVNAYLNPPSDFWYVLATNWPAAEVRGTRIGGSGSAERKAQPLESDASSNTIIFTNLDFPPDDPFLPGVGVPIYGSDVFLEPEFWEALPFTPKTDAHVKTVAAAIAWISGEKLVNLSIYSDNGGVPGAPLPGAQASTANIPTEGECCDLTTVTFAGAGVALSANVQYWVVADATDAPTFSGSWQKSAVQAPERNLHDVTSLPL